MEKHTNEVKPMIVEINRFYRPIDYVLDEYGDWWGKVTIVSNRGVTVLFTLDYERDVFVAKYSICNGDNFSKAMGILKAKMCKEPIIGHLTSNWSLRELLMFQIENILSDDTKLQDKKLRHTIKLLHHELSFATK